MKTIERARGTMTRAKKGPVAPPVGSEAAIAAFRANGDRLINDGNS